MDILDRIAAYDCSDGGHCDAAQGSAYDLLSDAADEIKALRAKQEWLRWGLEEICRGTDMRAGNGHAWEFGVANGALVSAGFDADAAGIQKPNAVCT